MPTTSATAARPATVQCPLCGTLNRVDLARLGHGPKCASCHRPLLLDRPLKVGAAEFDKVLGGTAVPVLVDFYADWCGPCRIMAPVLDEFARERAGEVLVLKLDTDASPAIASRFAIRGIPTMIAFRDGRETGRHVGVTDAPMLAKLAG